MAKYPQFHVSSNINPFDFTATSKVYSDVMRSRWFSATLVKRASVFFPIKWDTLYYLVYTVIKELNEFTNVTVTGT